MSKDKVVTRFAPSPTGLFHLGNVRTALYSYLFARNKSGKYILRVEDTDTERGKKEYEDIILESLEWLGLKHDEFFRQSERKDIYKNHLEKLIAEGKAYISKETPKEEGGRTEVIRFKNPNIKVVFEDVVRGTIEFDTTELKDFVIAKSLDEPIFHFAVVVDDFEMGITHVIRGEDHISNTPRQILIQEAIGAPRPIYAHLPLILAEDRSKLSKRKHGERVSLKYYIDKGYLKEAIINYIALLGWNSGSDQELFTLDQLVKYFELERVQKSGAVFDEQKLRWFNREYIFKLPEDVVQAKIREIIKRDAPQIPEEEIKRLIPLILERIHTFGDITDMINSGELDYVFKEPEYPVELLYWKGKANPEVLKKHLAKIHDMILEIDESQFSAENIKNMLWDYASQEGRGDVLWPARVALSGKEKSPDPFVLAAILGKERSLAYIQKALQKVSHA
jgi:glutamyl-tRNA synthetase